MQQFHVVYEDNHLLIVDKTAGVLVQGDKTGDPSLVESCKLYIKDKFHKPGAVFLGLVHRLDRPVSGLVIFARTSKALGRMNKIFKDRKIKKTYWAVVKNKPEQSKARLVHWLWKDEVKNMVKVFDRQQDGAQRAELSYITLGKLNDHFLLEVHPLTGRPHQIRAQLAAIGCPIRGDVKYGFPRSNSDKSINLHAKSLSFVHPVKKEPLTVFAGLPQNQFWEQFLVLEDKKQLKKKINNLY